MNITKRKDGSLWIGRRKVVKMSLFGRQAYVWKTSGMLVVNID